jgi:hypothetical protein
MLKGTLIVMLKGTLIVMLKGTLIVKRLKSQNIIEVCGGK